MLGAPVLMNSSTYCLTPRLPRVRPKGDLALDTLGGRVPSALEEGLRSLYSVGKSI